jgi:predicted tellurium resistance membrane protein TerC
VVRNIFVPIVLIALTDVALQLDNAIAISSVASSVPSGQRLAVVAGGVLLAACCLLTFSFLGSLLLERIWWIKPLAGVALAVIGVKLALEVLHR